MEGKGREIKTPLLNGLPTGLRTLFVREDPVRNAL